MNGNKKNVISKDDQPNDPDYYGSLVPYSSCRVKYCLPSVEAEFQNSIDADDTANMFTMRSDVKRQASYWQFLAALDAPGSDISPFDQAPGADSLLGQVMLSLFIGYWLWQGGGKVKHIPAPRQIRRAVEWIHANIDKDIYMEELARVSGVSIRSLQIGFKRQFGLGPVAYIIETRLRLAHEDLQTCGPAVTIAQIAKRWRFSRPGEFSAKYKALFGRYPSDMRREWRREAQALESGQAAAETRRFSSD